MLIVAAKMEFENEGDGGEKDVDEDEDEDEKATTSMDNIIPVKQISHGWRVLQGFAKVLNE
jgi:hypothetical protein